LKKYENVLWGRKRETDSENTPKGRERRHVIWVRVTPAECYLSLDKLTGVRVWVCRACAGISSKRVVGLGMDGIDIESMRQDAALVDPEQQNEVLVEEQQDTLLVDQEQSAVLVDQEQDAVLVDQEQDGTEQETIQMGENSKEGSNVQVEEVVTGDDRCREDLCEEKDDEELVILFCKVCIFVFLFFCFCFSILFFDFVFRFCFSCSF
jgi:hypothetical protein